MSKQAKSFDRGYQVVGHPPGALERAKQANERAWQVWNSHDATARAIAVGAGSKSPDMWDPDHWRRVTKKVAMYRPSKLLQTASAANTAAAIATRDGWLDVDVIHVTKGSATPAPAPWDF